jgi:nitroimidazol reductase NimA-like FMN-containing flavoprotein (pyridoxamine 5'-phosphate oxidase superfamily)
MQLTPTDRTRVRRLPNRGSFDTATVHAILDEALSCHVGFAIDGRPWVIPTIHARVADNLYLHGAVANHMLRTIDDGIEACVTATIVDGLVLARSAFHHSMNYRSAMVFGHANKVEDGDEKRAALHALVEHVVRGRSDDARPPSDGEMRKTLVLRLPIVEASAKIRTGGPVDDEEDLALPIWAGVLPSAVTFGTPIAEPGVAAPVPEYVTGYARA